MASDAVHNAFREVKNVTASLTCFDGTDEPYECGTHISKIILVQLLMIYVHNYFSHSLNCIKENTQLMSCNHLTANYGRISSHFTLLDKKFIHSSHNPVQKSAVLITVRSNYTIWLAFSKFNTEDGHFLRV